MKHTRTTGIHILSILWVMIITVLVGCQAEPPLPTPIVLPSLTPTPNPTATYTPSRTPTPYLTPTPAPTEFFGRAIQAGPGKGLLRVLNLTVDAPPVDFYLDGVPFINGLLQSSISGQTTVLPGVYTASLDAAGTNAAQALTVNPDQNLDVLVVGEGESRQFIVISQPTEPLNTGEIWLSFANAVPDVADITLTIDDLPAASLTGFSVSEPAITASGDKLLRATTGETVLLEEQISLRELTLYTFILTRNSTTGSVQLQRLEAPVLGRYTLRVVNLSAESREVDIYLNDEPFATAISGLGGSSTPTQIVTGTQRLSVYTTGADRAASMPLVDGHVFSGQVGSSLILLLTGPAADIDVTAHTVDQSPVPEGKSRLVFFNATEGIIGLQPGTGGQPIEELSSTIGLRQFSQAILIDPDDINFTFSDENNPDIAMVESKIISITAGQTMLYAATGRDDVPAPIYGYPVEQSAALNSDGQTIPQSRLRFVNALADGISVDIYVDGVLNMPMLFAGVGGPLTITTGETFALLIRQASDGPALLDIQLGIPEPGDYSVFIYGSPVDGLQATLISDKNLRINPDIGTLRLVNLSGDPVDVYSLAYYLYPPDTTPIAPTETPFPTLVPTLDPVFPATPAPTLEPLTAPQDVRRILRDVAPRTASNQNIAPQGFMDLTLLDIRNRILGSVTALQIPLGQHYDIVAYTYRTGTGEKTALFIAPYPPR